MDEKNGAPRQGRPETPHIDFRMAEEFLQALDPSGIFTFQTFDDGARKDPGLVRVFHGTFAEHRAELDRLNRAGAGVFVTVNKTDGKGRKSENVIGIRAVFLDLDGAPLPDEWPLEPHVVNESSPGKYHAYLLVAPEFPLNQFESVQKAIAARFDGDPSVFDLPRVMRIPGFHHQKGALFQPRIIRDWSQEPRYTAAQILAAFPPLETPRNEKHQPTDDPILKKLTEREMIIRPDREKGKHIILCPWGDTHTNGDKEAAYWLPNHGGFQGPGFKCLHAHCVNRTIKDLRGWLGGVEEKAKRRRALLRWISDVEAREIRWFWNGYLPRGALCLIDGDPGLGKSFLTLYLAAIVSKGGTFPTGEKVDPGGVVILSYEDDAGYTIRPRLEAMGADLTRIVLLEGVEEDDGKSPRLPHVADIQAIREAIEGVGAVLVIVDPLMAALPGAVDSHSDQNIRSVLAPLAKLAQETETTILVVRHLNKSGGGNALYRGGGSIGIVAAARAAYLVAKDPKDEARRILAPTKLNIAPEPRALQYRIAVNADDKAFLSWEGESDYRASDLLMPERQSTRDKSEAVEDFLLNRLKDGPVEADTLRAEIESMEISWKTAQRHKAPLGIESFRDGGSEGTWLWALKEDKGGHPNFKGAHKKDDVLLYGEGENTRRIQRRTCPPLSPPSDGGLSVKEGHVLLYEEGENSGSFQRRTSESECPPLKGPINPDIPVEDF